MSRSEGRSSRRASAHPARSQVQLKGRVACEINTCDALVLTEMVFENAFASMNEMEAVAVLTALVYEVCSLSSRVFA